MRWCALYLAVLGRLLRMRSRQKRKKVRERPRDRPHRDCPVSADPEALYAGTRSDTPEEVTATLTIDAASTQKQDTLTRYICFTFLHSRTLTTLQHSPSSPPGLLRLTYQSHALLPRATHQTDSSLSSSKGSVSRRSPSVYSAPTKHRHIIS